MMSGSTVMLSLACNIRASEAVDCRRLAMLIQILEPDIEPGFGRSALPYNISVAGE
jgi:hypothetical protein